MRFYCAFSDDGFDRDFLRVVEYLLMQHLSVARGAGDAENINHPPVAELHVEVIVES